VMLQLVVLSAVSLQTATLSNCSVPVFRTVTSHERKLQVPGWPADHSTLSQ